MVQSTVGHSSNEKPNPTGVNYLLIVVKRGTRLTGL
jgi:hypothetical protein